MQTTEIVPEAPDSAPIGSQEHRISQLRSGGPAEPALRQWCVTVDWKRVWKKPSPAAPAATKILPTSTALKLPRYPLQYQSLRGESLCSLQEFAQRCRAASCLWPCSWPPAAGAAAARRLRATRSHVQLRRLRHDVRRHHRCRRRLPQLLRRRHLAQAEEGQRHAGRDAAGDDAYRLRTTRRPHRVLHRRHHPQRRVRRGHAAARLLERRHQRRAERRAGSGARGGCERQRAGRRRRHRDARQPASPLRGAGPALVVHAGLQSRGDQRVDLATTPATVTVTPALVASLDLVEQKDLRVRGPLVSVDKTAGTYIADLRPFHMRAQRFGEVTVHTDANTVVRDQRH